MAVPATVIYFTTYDQLRDYLHTRMGSWSHYIPLLAGALARREYPFPLGSPHAHPGSRQVSVPTGSPGTMLMALGRPLERTELIPCVPSVAVGAVTVISPLELIRTKMQSQQLSYRELRVCIQSAVAQDGWLSLWRGWGPTVLRDVPFSGMPGGQWEMGAQGSPAWWGLACPGCPVSPHLVPPLPQLCTGLTTSW